MNPDTARRLAQTLAVLIGLVVLIAPVSARAADCPRSDGSFHGDCSLMQGDLDGAGIASGYLVARNNDNLLCYIHDLATGTTSMLSADLDCQEPLVSADGAYAVYTRGRSTIRLKALPDGTPETIATGRHPHPWYDGNGNLWVYYTTDSGNSREKTWWPDTGYDIKTRRVKVSTGECQTLLNWKAAGGPSRDGRFLGQGYATMMLFDTAANEGMRYRPCDDDGGTYTGTAYELYGGGQGCNPSMAPDNTYRLMHLYLPHLYFGIRNKDDNEQWRIIHDNDYEEWQSPEWSTDPDWASATVKNSNGRYGVVALQISTRHTYEVPGMGISDGDWSTPHLFLGDAAPPAEPSLQLETSSASLGAVTDGDNPPSQSINLANSGGGTLGNVSASTSYTHGSGWLDASVSGSGNTQSLNLTVDVAGLSAGTYAASVQLTVDGVSGSPASVGVELTVADSISLFDLQIYADATQVPVGGSLELWAAPVDQTDTAYAASITWAIAGGGSFTADTSDGPVTMHTTTFLSDGSEGSFEVTAVATSGSDVVRETFSIDVYRPNDEFGPPDTPTGPTDEAPADTAAADDGPIVLEGGCAFSATGWAPAWYGVLVAVLWRLRRRKRRDMS